MSQRRGGGSREPSPPVKIEQEDVAPLKSSAIPVTGPLTLDGNENNTNGHAGTGEQATESLSIDERFELERQNAKVKNWKEGAFAAGLVEVSWRDQHKYGASCFDSGSSSSRRRGAWAREEVDPDSSGCLCCSACVFGTCLGNFAGRVGNMVVLCQSQEWVEQVTVDEETGERTTRRYTRPRLDCLLGPYWPMLMCVTYPLILGVSGWTYLTSVQQRHWALQCAWSILTTGLIYSLAMTAFRDPGILYRTKSPPPQEEANWRWNDAAQSYRPRGAFFDSDTAVIVEEFDHTCPWTGTAIGKQNMTAFQCFVGCPWTGTAIGKKNYGYFTTFICLLSTCFFSDVAFLVWGHLERALEEGTSGSAGGGGNSTSDTLWW